MRNRIILLILLYPLCLPGRLRSQSDTIAIPIRDSYNHVNLEISIGSGSVRVNGYDGHYVKIYCVSRFKENGLCMSANQRWVIPQRKIEVRVSYNDNAVTIRDLNYRESGYIDPSKTVDMFVLTPRKSSVAIRAIDLGDILIENLVGDCKVRKMTGSVNLKNVAGAADVNVLSGNIYASFVSMEHRSNSMAFSTLNGNIDITLPSGLEADLILRSEWGEVFSDFQVNGLRRYQTEPPDHRNWLEPNWMKYGHTLEGQINGGGERLEVNNFYGTTFIRAAK